MFRLVKILNLNTYLRFIIWENPIRRFNKFYIDFKTQDQMAQKFILYDFFLTAQTNR